MPIPSVGLLQNIFTAITSGAATPPPAGQKNDQPPRKSGPEDQRSLNDLAKSLSSADDSCELNPAPGDVVVYNRHVDQIQVYASGSPEGAEPKKYMQSNGLIVEDKDPGRRRGIKTANHCDATDFESKKRVLQSNGGKVTVPKAPSDPDIILDYSTAKAKKPKIAVRKAEKKPAPAAPPANDRPLTNRQIKARQRVLDAKLKEIAKKENSPEAQSLIAQRKIVDQQLANTTKIMDVLIKQAELIQERMRTSSI